MSTDPNSVRTIPVLTPWSSVTGFDPSAEYGLPQDVVDTWDRLFRQLVLEVVQWEMPWLPDALLDAGATLVAAAPGSFEFVLPDGQRHQIPAIASRLQLVPWRMPEEPSH